MTLWLCMSGKRNVSVCIGHELANALYLGFVDFYGLLFKTADILLVFRKQRSVFHAVNRDDR